MISEERIAQIINDIAEDMGTYTKAELVDVINAQQNYLTEIYREYNCLSSHILIELSQSRIKLLNDNSSK